MALKQDEALYTMEDKRRDAGFNVSSCPPRITPWRFIKTVKQKKRLLLQGRGRFPFFSCYLEGSKEGTASLGSVLDVSDQRAFLTQLKPRYGGLILASFFFPLPPFTLQGTWAIKSAFRPSLLVPVNLRAKSHTRHPKNKCLTKKTCSD